MSKQSAARVLIFDFDGTIADSFTPTMEILAREFRQWGDRFNRRYTPEMLRGLTIREIMSTIPGGWWKFIYLFAKAKKHVRENASKINAYPGIIYTLRTLHDQGYLLLIVTSNNKKTVSEFLARFHLSELFADIYPTKGLFRKANTLKKVLHQWQITPGKDDCFYVGDEIRDIQACKKINLPIIAVSYGFNSYAGLKTYQPEYLLKKPTQLLQLLGSLKISQQPAN